ncbi:MAG: hypothetical protein KAR32_00225, partial [Candidatus Omnitrophica bacterium]|nr:hypothetical protein [Candidatus Omnitrophota bacterium]
IIPRKYFSGGADLTRLEINDLLKTLRSKNFEELDEEDRQVIAHFSDSGPGTYATHVNLVEIAEGKTAEEVAEIAKPAKTSSPLQQQVADLTETLKIDAEDIILKNINFEMLLNDYAESVGIKKDIAEENMKKAGLLAGGNLTKRLLNGQALEQFRNIQIESSSNPDEVDLQLIRLERIILNSLEVSSFISQLAEKAGQSEQFTVNAFKNNLPGVQAAWKLEKAAQLKEDKKIPLVLDLTPSEYYKQHGIETEFSIPSDRGVGERLLEAILSYQKITLDDMAKGGFNYRGGPNTKYNVKTFFEKVFLSEHYPSIINFIFEQFGKNGEDLDLIITNGIGANDQFMWALVEMYNRNRPKGAPKWVHVITARDLAGVMKTANPERTLEVHISRSGSTWEGTEVAKRLLAKGFQKMIVLANGGELKAVADQAGATALRIGMAPDIGGRNMHRKTSIYVTIQTILGIFLPSMDSKVFADLNHQFDVANNFDNPDSLGVKMGSFLHTMMETQGVEHIAFISNSNQIFSIGTEFGQFIMEGSNKEHVISWGEHDLTQEPQYVLSNLANGPAGKKMIGFAILDKASLNYNEESARVQALREKIPLMVFTIDSNKSDGFNGLSPTQQAAFDILSTDFITVLTTLLRVDANSNPNVKVVRELTAAYVAKWQEIADRYKTDAIGNNETDLLISLGYPGMSDIGGDKAFPIQTVDMAKSMGKKTAHLLNGSGMIQGRDRLNVFSGFDDSIPLMRELRNKTHLTDLVKGLGWIVEQGLYPGRAHKGHEATLAHRTEEEIAQEKKPLLSNKSINAFLNARELSEDPFFNEKFVDPTEAAKN